jgi:DtxR family transcriptional regulator, Mn-dependent transcriptional regulator
MIENQNKTEQEYIEIIYALEKQFRVARVKDIAEQRGVTRACVSLELNQLSKKNLISHGHYAHVTLTQKGKRLASVLDKRHRIIKHFLVHFLGISDAVAENDACNMEHIISSRTLESLSEFIDFVEKCPCHWKDVAHFFSQCSKYGSGSQECEQCCEIILKKQKI